MHSFAGGKREEPYCSVRLNPQVYRAIHTKNQRKDVKDETGEHTGLQHGIAVSVR